ncbi:MAG: NAD(P)/FAD-dependent oxidoreductase [Candidatus Binatia bacterium]
MKIAVVGAGISGLVASWVLRKEHDVTTFEAGSHIGGHTNTVDVEVGGRRHRVDTGFIVYNEKTYPNFCRLLGLLGVATQPSEMSFSVACERTGLEYATHSVGGLFARRRSAMEAGFYLMLADIVRFNRRGKALLRDAGDGDESLRSFLEREGFSRRFVEHYVVPMGAAIWSADPTGFLDFPARTFVRFFENHGLLDPREAPQWRVVAGGSRSYVDALTAPFHDRIHTNTPVLSARRDSDGVRLLLRDGLTLRFDHVVMACHSDQALRLLEDATGDERDVLGAVRYQANQVTLHTDASLMPARPAAWASWNYRIPAEAGGALALTYDMNRLQNIRSAEPLLVSLNSEHRIDSRRVLGRYRYHHPVYDQQAIEAQRERSRIDGIERTHFCGAYWGHGFHEDGVRSALAVGERFGLGL